MTNYNKFHNNNRNQNRNSNQNGRGFLKPYEEYSPQDSVFNDSVVDTPSEEPRRAIIHNCSRLNVRTGPSKLKDILCILNAGEEVVIDNVSGGWAHIYMSSGLDGYVMEEFLKEV